jgi:hypothetical protein
VEVDGSIRVGPAPFNGRDFSLIELDPDQPGPLLKVEYKLADDESGRFCRVLSSVFGLFVPQDPRDTGASELPVIRVEYEPAQRPAAHVQFHVSSAPLGWLYGVAGGNYRRSERLHFPVGSKRFRPTIEEFLLFLDRERIFRGWRPDSGWKKLARDRVDDYERRQARATVRHFAADIAEELTELGWTVNPPKVEPT